MIASKDGVKSASNLLHVGYSIEIDPLGYANTLFPLLGKDAAAQVRQKLYVCTLFKQSQLEMEQWLLKRSGKVANGVIYGLYLEEKRSIAVAEIRIGGQHYYLILASTINMPFQDLKKMANSGELGNRVAIEPPVPVVATPEWEKR